jgi:di/tricarboxylate transporter
MKTKKPLAKNEYHAHHKRVANHMIVGQIASIAIILAAALLFIFGDIYREGTGLVGVIMLFILGIIGWNKWTYYRNHHKLRAEETRPKTVGKSR